MLHEVGEDDRDCAIAQALSVVGDWWSLLVVRDLAGGTHRFDDLQGRLQVSRKVLTERLKALVEDGVAERRPYSSRPPRFEYHLTSKGRALLPVLVALQDWGSRYVMGDGELTGTAAEGSPEVARVHRLVGTAVPDLLLVGSDHQPSDVVDPTRPWTVLYCFPGAYLDDTQYPPAWDAVPGGPGCTLQATTFRDRVSDFDARHTAVLGVSTQPVDQLADLVRHFRLPFRLLSDENLELAAVLRLPTFRAGGDRLKRLTLIIDDRRIIRQVLYPIVNVEASIDEALSMIEDLDHARDRAGSAAAP